MVTSVFIILRTSAMEAASDKVWSQGSKAEPAAQKAVKLVDKQHNALHEHHQEGTAYFAECEVRYL